MAWRWDIDRRILFSVVAMELPVAFVIQLVRFALVAVVLGAIAKQFGAVPLLIAAGGILATRPVILRMGAQS